MPLGMKENKSHFIFPRSLISSLKTTLVVSLSLVEHPWFHGHQGRGFSVHHDAFLVLACSFFKKKKKTFKNYESMTFTGDLGNTKQGNI